MRLTRAGKGVPLLLGKELISILLLIAFVLAVSTMPPIKVQADPNTAAGYRVQHDSALWSRNLTAYFAVLRSGTLGRDQNGMPVGALVADRLGNSLGLLALALLFAVLPGVLKGVYDFRQLRRPGLAGGPLLTSLLQGIPDFLLVFAAQYGVVLLYKWSGWRPLPTIWDGSQPIRSLLLPVFCLALMPWAYVARVTSLAMGEVWEEEYIRTARAKGVVERAVVFRHALKNALVQVIDWFPNLLTIMLSNLLIVEWLFHFPGVTILLKDAVHPPFSLRTARSAAGLVEVPPDIPVLVAAGVGIGLVFSLMHLGVAVLRRSVDPRLRGGEGA